MASEFWGVPAALWLGTLTSISPCPLAANIAAVSFIGRRLDSPRRVLLAGAMYTLGRVVAYAALGMLIVASALSIPAVARALQNSMNKALGPLLIVSGILLLEWIRPVFGGGGVSAAIQKRAERGGPWGAGLLGFVCALTFCPVSAALFFGSLIPLAVRHGSSFGLPAAYGVGTGLPVIAFAILIALGARWVGRAFDRLTALERWARRATGVVFIGVGVYLTLVHVFGVLQ